MSEVGRLRVYAAVRRWEFDVKVYFIKNKITNVNFIFKTKTIYFITIIKIDEN